MNANPGAYAVLIGSGVSHGSGIPTGWEIVLDLIRKLAHLRGEDCEPNPEAWYRAIAHGEPDYSKILDEIARTSAERGQLLRAYFEPTEDELREGLKVPSVAHKSIATLVSKGYIRVIVTTNFDRLMEQALTEIGIHPTVISTPDAIKGAMPLTHSRCTIIKLHGDYLDARLKNTTAELASYDPAMDQLLDRVLDEFGLLVCGWSAEWDTALRAAIERCSTYRFSTFWGVRTKVNAASENLVALRRAIVVMFDADALFGGLAERITALEQFATIDPIAPKVAVARLKRYLSASDQAINLHDLVGSETERVRNAIDSDRFTVKGNDLTWDGVLQRLQAYEVEVHTLLSMMICGGYWSETPHDDVFLRSLKRIATDTTPRSGLTVLIKLRPYPASILMYGMGLAAIARRKYRFLRKLLTLRVRANAFDGENEVSATLHPIGLPIDGRLPIHYNNGSDYVFKTLREPLREYIPDDSEYAALFDWFEYLAGITYCNGSATSEELKKADAGEPLWGPIGRFALRLGFGETDIMTETQLPSNGPVPERVNDILEAGFFGSGHGEGVGRYRAVKRGFDTYILKWRAGWGAT